MKTHKVHTPEFGIPAKDVKVIRDIVDGYSGSTYSLAKKMLLKIFGAEITAEHFVVLGAIIGETVATDQARQKQINTLSLCQRQN